MFDGSWFEHDHNKSWGEFKFHYYFLSKFAALLDYRQDFSLFVEHNSIYVACVVCMFTCLQLYLTCLYLGQCLLNVILHLHVLISTNISSLRMPLTFVVCSVRELIHESTLLLGHSDIHLFRYYRSMNFLLLMPSHF